VIGSHILGFADWEIWCQTNTAAGIGTDQTHQLHPDDSKIDANGNLNGTKVERGRDLGTNGDGGTKTVGETGVDESLESPSIDLSQDENSNNVVKMDIDTDKDQTGEMPPKTEANECVHDCPQVSSTSLSTSVVVFSLNGGLISSPRHFASTINKLFDQAATTKPTATATTTTLTTTDRRQIQPHLHQDPNKTSRSLEPSVVNERWWMVPFDSISSLETVTMSEPYEVRSIN
jgi:hypothetical protein